MPCSLPCKYLRHLVGSFVLLHFAGLWSRCAVSNAAWTFARGIPYRRALLKVGSSARSRWSVQLRSRVSDSEADVQQSERPEVLKYAVILVGVLGLVPDSYWRGLPKDEREELAAEMAARRSDASARARYLSALIGVLCVGTAACDTACSLLHTLQTGQTPGLEALRYDALEAAVGSGFIFAALWLEERPLKKGLRGIRSRAREVPLVAPHMSAEVEALERAWRS